MTKEIRNTKDRLNHRWTQIDTDGKAKSEFTGPGCFGVRASFLIWASSFGFISAFGIRHLDFPGCSSSLFPFGFICVYLWFDPVFSVSRFSGAECSPLEWLPQSTFRFQIFP